MKGVLRQLFWSILYTRLSSAVAGCSGLTRPPSLSCASLHHCSPGAPPPHKLNLHRFSCDFPLVTLCQCQLHRNLNRLFKFPGLIVWILVLHIRHETNTHEFSAYYDPNKNSLACLARLFRLFPSCLYLFACSGYF